MEIEIPQHYDILKQIVAGLYNHDVFVEIGCSDGAHYNRIAPMFKRHIAVDIAPVGNFLIEGAEFYQMTSDDFFAHIAPRISPAPSFVFVDADHRKEFVLRDALNSLKILRATDGILTLHDTYPPSEEMVHGGCWNAWESAVELRKYPQYEVLTLPVVCMGITLIRHVPNKHCHWMT